jgi:TonB family protein
MRTVATKTSFRIASLILAAVALGHSSQITPAAQGPAPQPHRMLVSEASTSSLVLKKIPVKYPERALMAGIEGAVVLRIAIDTSGSVQVVNVVSGDPTLAQAATEAVRQWKYQPYQVDNGPVEIETHVTLSFRLPTPTSNTPPPLGTFEKDAYWNDYFRLYYPLSREWVRETELIRKRNSQNQAPGSYVLLVEVRIPPDNTELRADASFTLLAIRRSAQYQSDSCQQYLDGLASTLNASKSAKQKGSTSSFNVAGREFLRSDFEYRTDPPDHAAICSPSKDYLLLWSVQGLTKKAVETAASTISLVTSSPPQPKQDLSPTQASSTTRPQVPIGLGMTTGLLIKKVQPVYPEGARRNRIQGTITMLADISKTGDVTDLELIDGPIELAVSAVNAVRQWKYRSYLLNGEPVSVKTAIQVNYILAP